MGEFIAHRGGVGAQHRSLCDGMCDGYVGQFVIGTFGIDLHYRHAVASGAHGTHLAEGVGGAGLPGDDGEIDVVRKGTLVVVRHAAARPPVIGGAVHHLVPLCRQTCAEIGGLAGCGFDEQQFHPAIRPTPDRSRPGSNVTTAPVLYRRWAVRQTAVMKRLSVTLCVALAVGACSSQATKTTGSSTTVPGGDATTTTAAAPATTTDVAATTTTVVATTVAATTSTAPEGGFGEPVPADTSPTAWVAGAEEGDPEVAAAAGVCEPFYAAIGGGPNTVQRCGIWNAVGGQRMWTITKGVSGQFFAIIWQQNAPNNWVPRMRAREEAPGVWADFAIRTGNIDAGPNDELVSGARFAGTGQYLDLAILDIRSGNPRVMAVSNGISKASAVLRAGGGVEFWSAIFAPADPGCCPSSFQRFTIYAAGSDWLVVPGPTVAPDDPSIPLSEF